MQSPKQILRQFDINLPPDQEEKVIEAIVFYHSQFQPEEEEILILKKNKDMRSMLDTSWLKSAGRGILH